MIFYALGQITVVGNSRILAKWSGHKVTLEETLVSTMELGSDKEDLCDDDSLRKPYLLWNTGGGWGIRGGGIKRGEWKSTPTQMLFINTGKNGGGGKVPRAMIEKQIQGTRTQREDKWRCNSWENWKRSYKGSCIVVLLCKVLNFVVMLASW